MKKKLKDRVLKYLEIQKNSYEQSLNNKLLNNRMIGKKFKNAKQQIQNMLDDVMEVMEEVKKL